MEKQTYPTLEDCRHAIDNISSNQSLTERELRHRTRILYLMNRLVLDDMSVLLEELAYQKSLGIIPPVVNKAPEDDDLPF